MSNRMVDAVPGFLALRTRDDDEHDYADDHQPRLPQEYMLSNGSRRTGLSTSGESASQRSGLSSRRGHSVRERSVNGSAASSRRSSSIRSASSRLRSHPWEAGGENDSASFASEKMRIRQGKFGKNKDSHSISQSLPTNHHQRNHQVQHPWEDHNPRDDPTVNSEGRTTSRRHTIESSVRVPNRSDHSHRRRGENVHSDHFTFRQAAIERETARELSTSAHTRSSYTEVMASAATMTSAATSLFANLLQTLGEEEVQTTVEPPKEKQFFRAPPQSLVDPKSPEARLPDAQYRTNPTAFGNILGLREEEALDDFEHLRVKQGIETARKTQKPATKTTYEVDAPRAGGLGHDPTMPSPTHRENGDATDSVDFESLSTESSRDFDRLFHEDSGGENHHHGIAEEEEIFESSKFLAPSDNIFHESVMLDEEIEIEEVVDADRAEAVISSFQGILKSSDREKQEKARRLLERRNNGDDLSLPSLDSVNTGDYDATKLGASEISPSEALQEFMETFLVEREQMIKQPPKKSVTAIFQWSQKANVDKEEQYKFKEEETRKSVDDHDTLMNSTLLVERDQQVTSGRLPNHPTSQNTAPNIQAGSVHNLATPELLEEWGDPEGGVAVLRNHRSSPPAPPPAKNEISPSHTDVEKNKSAEKNKSVEKNKGGKKTQDNGITREPVLNIEEIGNASGTKKKKKKSSQKSDDKKKKKKKKPGSGKKKGFGTDQEALKGADDLNGANPVNTQPEQAQPATKKKKKKPKKGLKKSNSSRSKGSSSKGARQASVSAGSSPTSMPSESTQSVTDALPAVVKPIRENLGPTPEGEATNWDNPMILSGAQPTTEGVEVVQGGEPHAYGALPFPSEMQPFEGTMDHGPDSQPYALEAAQFPQTTESDDAVIQKLLAPDIDAVATNSRNSRTANARAVLLRSGNDSGQTSLRLVQQPPTNGIFDELEESHGQNYQPDSQEIESSQPPPASGKKNGGGFKPLDRSRVIALSKAVSKGQKPAPAGLSLIAQGTTSQTPDTGASTSTGDLKPTGSATKGLSRKSSKDGLAAARKRTKGANGQTGKNGEVKAKTAHSRRRSSVRHDKDSDDEDSIVVTKPVFRKAPSRKTTQRKSVTTGGAKGKKNYQ